MSPTKHIGNSKSLQSPECYSPCRGLPLPVTARKTSKPHYFLALIARALTGHLNWISRHSSPSSLRVMGESTQCRRAWVRAHKRRRARTWVRAHKRGPFVLDAASCTLGYSQFLTLYADPEALMCLHSVRDPPKQCYHLLLIFVHLHIALQVLPACDLTGMRSRHSTLCPAERDQSLHTSPGPRQGRHSFHDWTGGDQGKVRFCSVPSWL